MVPRARSRRWPRWLAIATGALLLAIAALLASPVHTWRTGETPLPPLVYADAAVPPPSTARVWIDTDAACGSGPWRDPDDCLALLALLRSGRDIAGISTTYGNAPIATTDALARELVQQRGQRVPVQRGCGAPRPHCTDDGGSADAQTALAHALAAEPLVYVALGPLTNLADALQRDPGLARRLVRVIAVMGHRPGHRFHPTEGRSPHAMLFGHGPVFHDLNATLDPAAVQTVLASGAPIELVPYSAARQVLLTADDLATIAALGPDGEWVARRSREWLQQWRASIGLDGFYPFDLLAAARVLLPQTLQCADVSAAVARDTLLPLFGGGPQLLVWQGDAGDAMAGRSAPLRYCGRVQLRPCALFGRCDGAAR
jgi:inosine-uridine nucleoside N-ribohydrolase